MPKTFTADQFVAGRLSSVEDKAKFANQLIRFVESDFKPTQFPKWFYQRLSMCFGHIAHTNQGGFYHVWFETPKKRLEWLEHISDAHIYGDAEWTFCDAEKVVQTWVRQNFANGSFNRFKEKVETDRTRLIADITANPAKYADMLIGAR